MIRVCYVVDAPFLGGAEWYVSRLATALDRARFEPFVLMRAGATDPGLSAWADALRAGGVEVDAIPMRLPFRPGDAVRMWRWLDRRGPDIVHVNMPGPYDGQMGLAVPVARAAGARTVVTEHLPMVGRLWKRALVKALAYRHLDVAVTMTRVNAGYLERSQGVQPARIRVVANGVRRDFGSGVDRESTRRALGVEGGECLVVQVGNILRHKGLYATIEALLDVVSPWHLVVAGSGPDAARCRELVDSRGAGKRVSFLGACPAADVESVIAAADVLALPSEIEGLPYTVLEAMACGVPVVAGNAYGVPEAVDDGVTGLLVDPRDAGDIARAFRRLFGDPELRARMGAAARRRFEADFTLELQASRMQALYASLAGAHAGGGGS